MVEKDKPPGMRKWQMVADLQKQFHPWVKLKEIPTCALLPGLTDQCCCQLIWQNLPLVSVQERRGRCSLAMERLIREFIWSPWVWLGLTQKVFGERLLSLGNEESDPKDGMCIGEELGLFREVSLWMPWSCCPMCFVLKRVLYASSWRLYRSANIILSRFFTVPEICSLPYFPNLGNGDNI